MFVFECPHCAGTVTVEAKQLNCKIFRHAIFKADGKQVPPHASRANCEMWVEKNLVWGCGKPFRFDGKNATKCDYI